MTSSSTNALSDGTVSITPVFTLITHKADATQAILAKKLPISFTSSRPGPSSTKLVYLECWQAIHLSNTIFGFNGWSSSIISLDVDFLDETSPGKFSVGVSCVMKITLSDSGSSHEDTGYGSCDNMNKGAAIQGAKKEAVSDARKRCLRVFGDALGNCLYDKKHLNRIKTPQGNQGDDLYQSPEKKEEKNVIK